MFRVLKHCLLAMSVIVGALVVLLLLGAEIIPLIEDELGWNDDVASISFDNGLSHLSMTRQPVWHPFLRNEYTRSLILSRAGQKPVTIEFPVDTGGDSEVQLFDVGADTFVLADAAWCHRLNLRNGDLQEDNPVHDNQRRYLGAFGETEDRSFKFSPPEAKSQIFSVVRVRSCTF